MLYEKILNVQTLYNHMSQTPKHTHTIWQLLTLKAFTEIVSKTNSTLLVPCCESGTVLSIPLRGGDALIRREHKDGTYSACCCTLFWMSCVCVFYCVFCLCVCVLRACVRMCCLCVCVLVCLVYILMPVCVYLCVCTYCMCVCVTDSSWGLARPLFVCVFNTGNRFGAAFRNSMPLYNICFKSSELPVLPHNPTAICWSSLLLLLTPPLLPDPSQSVGLTPNISKIRV